MKHKLGIVITSIWALLVSALIVLKWNTAKSMDLNEWGDFVAGVSSLLALAWLVMGYFQQSEELRLNTEALKCQRDEMKAQVEETKALVAQAAAQADAMQELANVTKRAAAQERWDRILGRKT